MEIPLHADVPCVRRAELGGVGDRCAESYLHIAGQVPVLVAQGGFRRSDERVFTRSAGVGLCLTVAGWSKAYSCEQEKDWLDLPMRLATVLKFLRKLFMVKRFECEEIGFT